LRATRLKAHAFDEREQHLRFYGFGEVFGNSRGLVTLAEAGGGFGGERDDRDVAARSTAPDDAVVSGRRGSGMWMSMSTTSIHAAPLRVRPQYCRWKRRSLATHFDQRLETSG
jgi:hypothetical protein